MSLVECVLEILILILMFVARQKFREFLISQTKTIDPAESPSQIIILRKAILFKY